MTVPGGAPQERSCTCTRGPSQVRVAGPLALHADGFRAALAARGFSPWSQMFYLHLLADVSRWLGLDGLEASGLTDANASAFMQDRRSRGRARFRGMQGLALLLSFLRPRPRRPVAGAAEPGDETGGLVAEFAGVPGWRARPEAADRDPAIPRPPGGSWTRCPKAASASWPG